MTAPAQHHQPRENSMSFPTTAARTPVQSIDAAPVAVAASRRTKPFDFLKAVERGATYLTFILLLVAAPIPILVVAKMLYMEMAKLSAGQLMQLM